MTCKGMQWHAITSLWSSFVGFIFFLASAMKLMSPRYVDAHSAHRALLMPPVTKRLNMLELSWRSWLRRLSCSGGFPSTLRPPSRNTPKMVVYRSRWSALKVHTVHTAKRAVSTAHLHPFTYFTWLLHIISYWNAWQCMICFCVYFKFHSKYGWGLC
jgi:hypothetical protein